MYLFQPNWSAPILLMADDIPIYLQIICAVVTDPQLWVNVEVYDGKIVF